MPAFFRVDASPTIGTGHLSRCLTLARALARRGVSIEVGTHAPSAATEAWIAREGHRVVPLRAPDDLEEVRTVAAAADLVIVDGYAFDRRIEDELRAPGRIVCAIDDLADRAFGADVIVNGNLYGDTLRYAADPGCILLLGPRYALVRDEFVEARAARLARRDHGGRPRLLVTMGGADPTHETEKAIAALGHIPIPLDVRIVVGGANPRALAIRAASARVDGHTVDVRVDVTNMGELMAWTDVALTAAGSTCLELACVGVAAVTLVIAENQRAVADAFARNGLMPSLGWHADVDAHAVAAGLTTLLADRDASRAMTGAQRDIVDGLGPSRVSVALESARVTRT